MENNKEYKRRTSFYGIVVSNKMKDTVVVERELYVLHPKYGKRKEKKVKLHAHDRGNTCKIGDRVLIESCRPLSRTKRWRVVKIIEKATEEAKNE